MLRLTASALAPRPRLRLAASGPGVFSDGELAALVLGARDTEGERLVDRFGGSAFRLARAPVRELCGPGRLSLARASRLQAAFELGRRALDAPLDRGEVIRGSAAVAERLRGRLATLEHEELHVLGVDTRNTLLIHFVAASGSANVVRVQPRDVYRPLLREGCAGLILVHNHPSGRPDPSEDDARLTRHFLRAGELVGVGLLDHVILARGGHYSFADSERLRKLIGG